MSKPIHTPGPLTLREGGYRWSFQIETLNVPLAHAKATHTDRQETHANARLLAAAYNAFDSAARKLNLNAVEFAERMQDGGLYDLIVALKLAEHTMSHMFTPGHTENAEELEVWAETLFLPSARGALAKVKGGAT